MKRRILSIIALAVCAVLLASVMCACGNNSDNGSVSSDNGSVSSDNGGESSDNGSTANSIIGSWEYESGGYVYTFNEDGTGSYDASGTLMEFTYTDNGTSVEILYTGNTDASTYDYKIENNKLIIKDSIGNDVVYVKK